MLGSKLPLFSYGRDGHQLYSRGLYSHEIRIPVIKGGIFPIPDTRSGSTLAHICLTSGVELFHSINIPASELAEKHSSTHWGSVLGKVWWFPRVRVCDLWEDPTFFETSLHRMCHPNSPQIRAQQSQFLVWGGNRWIGRKKQLNIEYVGPGAFGRNLLVLGVHFQGSSLGFILLMEEIRLTSRDVKHPVNNGMNYLSSG